jgi:hypothetical protein
MKKPRKPLREGCCEGGKGLSHMAQTACHGMFATPAHRQRELDELMMGNMGSQKPIIQQPRWASPRRREHTSVKCAPKS